MKLPESYLAGAKSVFGDSYPEYLAAIQQQPVSSLRINTGRISAAEFRNLSPWPLEQVPWCSEGFYFDSDQRPGTHPYYYAGLYYIQEASAMAPAAILPVHEGDLILDACAAPGGKSTALAARLNNTGLLVSNDISPSRQNATLKNMERFGIANSCIISHDLRQLKEKMPAAFDGILVDAPCSGEGMFRKDPSLITSWLQKGSQSYVPVQKEIITSAWDLLKPGGHMVYSTCTFSPEENEQVIAHLCENRDDVILEPSALSSYFEPGILEGYSTCMRLYPHRIKGEGHFAALLKKKGTSSPSVLKNQYTEMPSDPGFREFMKLIHDPHQYTWMVKNDRIYRLANPYFDTGGIRVIRSGLFMGTLKNGRFEPSQHLAFTLNRNTFENTVSYAADDIRTEKYLRGETIRDDSCQDGWVLVTADGYPLGFGKCSGHVIKNKIEKGYRKL